MIISRSTFSGRMHWFAQSANSRRSKEKITLRYVTLCMTITELTGLSGDFLIDISITTDT